MQISTKSDIFVKFLFGQSENEDLLIDFINSVFEDSNQTLIRSAKVLNPFNIKQCLNDKESILDVKCETDKSEIINIEMQLIGSSDYQKRALYYWARCYGGQLKQTELYSLLKPVISIHLLDFNLFEYDENQNKTQLLNDSNMHHCFGIFEKDNPKVCFSKDFQMHLIEMPKFSLKIQNAKSLLCWVDFFENLTEGQGGKKMVFLAEKNSIMEKAYEQFKIFTSNDEIREIVEAREKAKRDKISQIYSARVEGRKEGIVEGRKEGAYNTKIDSAKKMLAINMDAKIISDILDLSIEEINKLK